MNNPNSIVATVARLPKALSTPTARSGVAAFTKRGADPARVTQRNGYRAGSCGIGRPVIARAAYSMWRAASRAARAISRTTSPEKFVRSRH